MSPGVGRRSALRDRLYAWWWWRGPNRPYVADRTYLDLLAALPQGSVGLDLGSRNRIRPDAITLDFLPGAGNDVVGDGHDLPFADGAFDYVWSNAVLEHVRNPFQMAAEIKRVVRPGGLVFIQVPFLEYVHGWPDDYWRFTQNGLRELFAGLEEVAVGVSAGPGQVVTDIAQGYLTGLRDLQQSGLAANLFAVLTGSVLLPLRFLDRLIRRRPLYWRWARAYYYVGRKPGVAAVPGLRSIFITPETAGGGFEEVMRIRTEEMVLALARTGSVVLPLPASHLERRDAETCEAVAGFRPELVIAPNLNYYLLSLDETGRMLSTPGARTSLLWDDPIGALALWLVHRRGPMTLGSLGPEVTGNVLDLFRGVTRAPGVHHFAWDSGHAAAMVELGLVDPEAVSWYPIATFPPFLAQGRAGRAIERRDVAFCGNVYPASVERSNFTTMPFATALVDRVRQRKVRDLGLSAWQLLREELAGFTPAEIEAHGLDPHRSPFWDFYLYVAWLALNTAVRLELLTSIGRPVDLFGMFNDPDGIALLGRYPSLVFRGNAHQSSELPRVFAETRVNVCLSNTLIYQGVPSKFIDCVASGGFALVDAKDDLVRLFGKDVEAIVFRNAGELGAKIDYYLAHPDERREIVAWLRGTIERECTLDRLFERVVAGTGDARRAPVQRAEIA